MKLVKSIFTTIKVSIFTTPFYFLGLIITLILGVILLPLQQILYMNGINEANLLIGSGNMSWKFTLYFGGYILIYRLMNGETTFVAFSNIFFGQYTTKMKTFYENYYMYKTYKIKQDSYYKNSFYQTITNITQNGIDSFSLGMAGLLTLTFSLVGSISAYVIILLKYLPSLLIIIAALIIFQTIILKYLTEKFYNLNINQIKEARYSNYYNEVLCERKYSREIRSYFLGERIFREWKQFFLGLQKERYKFSIKQINTENAYNFIIDMMNWFIILLYILHTSKDKFNVGEVVMLWSTSRLLIDKARSCVGWSMKQVYKNFIFTEDYLKILGMPKLSEIYLIRNCNKDDFVHKEVMESAIDNITINNVSYRYPQGERKSLNHIELNVKKGEKVAILGYNGSGKTTLGKILCGILEPTEGNVNVNHINIWEKDPILYYKHFGIAFQDYGRFNLTLGENIRIGDISKSDSEGIKSVIETLKLNHLVDTLPKGLDTYLGKEYDIQGEDISGGEWQKIILARAYFGHKDVVILDEPTASIDPLAEATMIDDFKQLIGDRTAILISHKISFARLADRIIIMNNGEIVEQGTHKDLLEQHGLYSKIFLAQRDLYKGWVFK